MRIKLCSNIFEGNIGELYPKVILGAPQIKLCGNPLKRGGGRYYWIGLENELVQDIAENIVYTEFYLN